MEVEEDECCGVVVVLRKWVVREEKKMADIWVKRWQGNGGLSN